MAGGGGKQSTTTNAIIPNELKPLYENTAGGVINAQNLNPLSNYFGYAPRQISEASPWQAQGMSDLRGLSPNAMAAWGQAFRNQAGAQGLNRDFASAGQAMRQAQGAGQVANRLASGPVDQSRQAADLYSAGRAASQQRVSGADIANDPVLAAQKAAFQKTAIPMINNQMGAMGLGRSGATGGAVADAWANAATPLMQEAAARNERAIDRAVSGDFNAAQGFQGLGNQYISQLGQGMQGMLGSAGALNSVYGNQLGQAAQAQQAGNDVFQQLLGVQGQDFNQGLSRAGQTFGWGTALRGQNQEVNDANYDERMRLQGLAENALYTPFGQMGNTIGQRSTSSGGGK